LSGSDCRRIPKYIAPTFAIDAINTSREQTLAISLKSIEPAAGEKKQFDTCAMRSLTSGFTVNPDLALTASTESDSNATME